MKRILVSAPVVVALVTGAVATLVLAAPAPARADDCIQVEMAVQLNQYPLMPNLAKRFNASDAAEVDGKCIHVSVSAKSSGAAATLLEAGWPDPAQNGPKPVVWSPASNSWRLILNQRLTANGRKEMAPPGTPEMVSPLVIAMPEPMAKALGWPAKPLGYSDILALATNRDGWASVGQPWGPFKLGKTNPNFSTSGLSSLIAEYYALTGKKKDLTQEDVENQVVNENAKAIESSVVHYGDTTLTFLNNMYEADRREAPLGAYASAISVEEQSVINYNKGNPDGKLEPGEVVKPPHVPLVAIYPSEGTIFSDNPFIILDAKWVSPQQKRAAAEFGKFVQLPVNQHRVLQYGFRPGNDSVALSAPIDAKFGLDPDQPKFELAPPEPEVLAGLIDQWEKVRKGARVLVVTDVSGSMSEPVPGSNGKSKLALAKRAASGSLTKFRADDLVGLWAFTDGIGPDDHPDYKELAAIAPIGSDPKALQDKIASLGALSGTPLYDVSKQAYDAVEQGYDSERINAVVLLSDGQDSGSGLTLRDLADYLESKSESTTGSAVRIFTIAYGADADVNAMKRIARATNGAYYDAKDPSTIVDVLNAVVSNF